MKLLLVFLLSVGAIFAEQTLADRIHNLRSLPDDQRITAEKDLALKIRQLPASNEKENLAFSLANLVTEGDPGHKVLQETATTLADALRERPAGSDEPYLTLAQLVRYEHVDASLKDSRFLKAMDTLKAEDERREHLDLTLKDLTGKSWTLRQLTGKVVIVNFWATWCPPCRKEMPDLDALYNEYRDKGLVILAISDEERATVSKFLGEHPVTYPILLDPGRHVNEAFAVHGIPKTFVYDRLGHLAAESIDMRTRRQFEEMLKRAGL